ncbi:Ras-like GTP-binding protein RYL2 [Vanrija pseudolonga]|uniref:Ras-like GTP-binding protein RYL2 n=1 Tax=Vanrija pseudolonga TaxID=143232 RepID=A0AAF1BH13_9TREE|nr:Ras-like GTP-binding protein RYL2 [Vanrija pseudolonga]
MATSGTAGPASVRMQESRSADSRTRLRSTGGAKLIRYPTIANEHPSATARRDLRRLGVESSTPPRIFPGASSEVDNDLDYGGPDGLEAKVVLLGSQGVGKTSLILRLTTGSFSAIPAPASLDGSLYKRKLVHNGVPVKLQIWDTAGQERFRSMAPIYYRGAHVCILVYDITDRKSFQDVRSWLEELGGKASKDMLIYVVGAKIDLERQRAVTFGEARRTIRTWLKPPPPEPEGLPEVLSPTGRSLFRSTSTRARTDSSIGASPPRTRPHSMHGLASLMASVSDFADFDHSPASSQASTAAPTLVAPTPVPTVHFPASLTTSSGSASQSTSPIDRIQPLPRRQQRVSFHALQSPEMALPTFATTTETAVASTVNAGATATSRHNSSHRFSISGVLGLGRTTSVSEAVTNLASLAEANPVSVARSPTLRSPMRARTESSPMLGNDLPRKRSDDWTTNRAWGRGEGPRAADALEEFGANVRGGSADRLTAGTSAFSQSSNFLRPGRARGGSLGRDSRLYGSDDEDDASTPNEVQWGVEIEGIRLGEVSSLTGEGVEIMCRSISSALVERKDKIERERSLRRKNSVMLTDPSKNQAANKAKGRFGCCA